MPGVRLPLRRVPLPDLRGTEVLNGSTPLVTRAW
jgi:hypothetical protein